MKIVSRQFTNRKSGDFEKLSLNKDLMKKIVDDMRNHAGMLSPLNHWHLVEKDKDADDLAVPDSSIADLYDESMEKSYDSAEKMLDAWIGCKGLQSLSEEDIENNKFFLNRVDAIGIFDYISKNGFEEYDYKTRDMATIAEVNMLYASLLQTKDDIKYILEIGGGYGRIAEALMNVADGIKYVMVDAVPGSILYSYEYLKMMLPDKKVGFYYLDDEFNLEKYDIYVIPAWHFEEKNNYQYDCCINISSMQEMGQGHVDYYLDLFDRVLKENGIAYIQNSHDYIFKGEWNFKNSWERLSMFNTPASWTEYFPTEIFRKTRKDNSFWNASILGGYEYSLYEKRILNNKINDLQNEIWRLEYAEAELEKCRKENEELKKNKNEELKGEKTERKKWKDFFMKQR